MSRKARKFASAATALSLLLLACCSDNTPALQQPAVAQQTQPGPQYLYSPAPSPTSTPTSIPPHFQTMTGMGVNANVHSWDNGELRPAIDQIALLGPLMWRVIIDRADWEPTRHGAADDYDWAYYDAIYSSGKMADLWNTIAYIESKPGQQVMVNVMGGVPQWMGGTTIKVADEDYWVRMISSMVYYGTVVKKLDITLLAPMNEPDLSNGVEGPTVGPAQYVRLLHKLALSLDKLGLDNVDFVGPDTASAAEGATRYMPAMEADPVVVDKFAHLGVHSYDGSVGPLPGAIADSAYPYADYWVTEFSGPCPGCDTGAPNPASWDTARATAAQAISLLQAGAAGLQFYDAWDGYYEHHQSMGYWGALAYSPGTHRYMPRKSYYVLKQLMEFTPPGMMRIPAATDTPDVSVVAFLNPATGNVTVFGQNTGSKPVTANITLTAFGYTGPLRNYQSNPTLNMAREPNVSMLSSSAAVGLAGDSVFTLTSTP